MIANRKIFIKTVVIVIILVGVLWITKLFVQEDKKLPVNPASQSPPRISSELQDIINNTPNRTVNIFIKISYDPASRIREELDESDFAVRIKELEKKIQDAAASGMRGNPPEYLALLEERDEAELAKAQEFTRRLKEAYKPSQDEVSRLVESLNGEVTNRYTTINLLAARIEARQILELIKSPLVGEVSEVGTQEAL